MRVLRSSVFCTCSLYTLFLPLTSRQVSLLPRRWIFGDGMCSCCCLPLSHRCLCLSAWGLWDCGRAALPWQRAVLPNCVHLGFGVSLRSSPSLLFIPPSSQVFFGVAEAISGSLSLSLSASHLSLSTAYHPQTYSHIRNETHIVENKIHVHTGACASITTFPLSTSSFHFLCSRLYFVPSPFPCGGSNTALRDTTVPRVPPAYITVSSLL